MLQFLFQERKHWSVQPDANLAYYLTCRTGCRNHLDISFFNINQNCRLLICSLPLSILTVLLLFMMPAMEVPAFIQHCAQFMYIIFYIWSFFITLNCLMQVQEYLSLGNALLNVLLAQLIMFLLLSPVLSFFWQSGQTADIRYKSSRFHTNCLYNIIFGDWAKSDRTVIMMHHNS